MKWKIETETRSWYCDLAHVASHDPASFVERFPAHLHVRELSGPGDLDTPVSTTSSSLTVGVLCPLTSERKLRIGRSPTCDITIHDLRLSRVHVWIAPADDGWFITDARSTNGTTVDGARLTAMEPVPLRPGMRVVLADAIEVLFLDPPGLRDLVLAAEADPTPREESTATWLSRRPGTSGAAPRP